MTNLFCIALWWFKPNSLFSQGLQAGQSLFKLAAAHLFAVHEQAEDFAREIALALHGPGDDGLIALGPEREFRRIGGLHRLLEFEPETDGLTRLARGDGHLAGSYFAVAVPGHRRARASLRAGEGAFAVRVELGPRRPRLPKVQVVDVRKYRFRRRGEGCGARDDEVVRLPGNQNEDQNGDEREGQQDGQHKGPLGLKFS